MLNKKDRMKTSKLSSTVLDYYYKYGQNRDLEKYLRLKRQSTSKSSSDSSLRNYAGGDSTLDSRRITKSMEKLNLSDRKSLHDDEQKPTKSTENINQTKRDKSKERQQSNDNQPIKIEKKTQQQWKSKSKSKSYNFNLESSIEINLPTTSSLPALSTAQNQVNEIAPESSRIQQLESSETQTDAFLMKSEPTALVKQTSTSMSAVEKKSNRTIEKTPQESIQETSPASSVASAKVRLEWDSMADIGYNRIIDFKSQSNTNLTTFERSALTKFFAKRGLNFDENLVILAPADTKSPLQKRKFTQSAIEMRDAQKITNELPKLSPSTDKQMWEKALVKYREKYGKSKGDGPSGIDTTQFMDAHHSTPLPGEMSSSRFSDEPSNVAKMTPTEMMPEKSRVQQIENWSQTSSIDVGAIGIQVEQAQIQRISRSVQIEIEQVHESTQKDDDDLTTATSFEFLDPNAYKPHRQVIEQAIPIPTTSTVDEMPTPQENKNEMIFIQEENPDDKENIPPIDNKENIPPPPLHGMHRTDQPCALKTPENTVEINEKVNETTMLPNDLQKGVDLINALIDSRTTDSATKKKLIRKIVRHLLKSRDTKDITQMIMSYSEKSNSKISGVSTLPDLEKSDDNSIVEKVGKDTISGISTLSSSSDNVPEADVSNQAERICKNDKMRDNQQNREKKIDIENVNDGMTDENEGKEVKEWLLPVTQSEIEKERKRQSLQQLLSMPENPPKMFPNENENENKNNIPEKPHHDPVKNVQKSAKSGEILEFLENEKKTHYNWIDQEIEHLKNLKLLLKTINSSESDESKGDISDEKINSVYAKHNRDYLTIYENFRRNRKHTSGNGSQADVSSTLIDSSKSSEESSRFLNCGKMGSKSHWIHKTTLESPPSTISSGSKMGHNSSRQIKPKEPTNELPKWDSHLNMQQMVKNRTKLKTPNSDESIEAYAKACRAKFERKCAKATKMDSIKCALAKTSAQNQPIYTKPYSSDSYSDIQNMQRSNEDRLKEKQHDMADGYTSVTESDGFLSPNSISIGVAANSTSNTTTHQYDTKISIGLQTTNTLERMPMIQMKKPVEIAPEPKSPGNQPTIRVNKLTINKQLQVRPEALAYIIMFKDEPNGDENGNSKGQECGNQLYTNSSRINSAKNRQNISNTSTASDDRDDQPNKRTHLKDPAIQLRDRSSDSNSSSSISFENLTLQEYLQARRPDFYANAEQRRKCLNDLHNLRQQRNEQRKKLLAMNIYTNAKTLNRNMKRLLPPPPLAQMRIFKSREIISQTRRKYRKLPEILQRQQMERDIKIRRNHRILVNVFNKNLQKHVLSGKTDLSNSIMIN